MRLRLLTRWIALGAILAAAIGGPVRAETIRIGGTGAGMVTLTALGDAIRAASGVAVRPLPSLGSAGGIRALNDGRIDMAVLGRVMSEEEAKAGAQVAAVLRTPFVFVTSEKVAPSMRAEEIVAAFADPRARWPGGQPVTVVLRQRSDADAMLLDRMFEGMAAAVAQTRTRPEVPVSIVDDDNAEIAERTAGSLATMSYSHLMIEGRRLRAVAIDGVAPSLETFASGRYRFGRPFLLVVPARPSAAAMRVVSFLKSAAGAEALRGVHCLIGDAP